MLELKFAIYYRAASLPSQASYAVLAEESQAFFKHSLHTKSISNSAQRTREEKWRRKGSHSSLVSGSNHLV